MHSTNGDLHVVYYSPAFNVRVEFGYFSDRAFSQCIMKMMLNSASTFEKYSGALPYKEGDVMLKGSSDERSQSRASLLAWLW